MSYNIKHSRLHVMNSSGLNFDFNRFLHIVQLVVCVGLSIVSIYCYYNYIKIDKDIVNHELTKNNTLIIQNNSVVITGSKFDHVFKFSKKFARRHNFKGIEINGREIRLNETASTFYYVIDADNIQVKSNYLLKPSSYQLKLFFGDQILDYNLLLAYEQKFDNRTTNIDYWKEIPAELAALTTAGLELLPVSGRKASSLVFKRGYENHVIFETEFVPHNSPLNMSLFLNLGTSIFLGVNNNHSIEIIQSKYDGDKKLEKTVQRADFLFEKNAPCKASVEVYGNKYVLTLTQAERSTTLTYTDKDPEHNIKEKYKNFGVGLWKGSEGLTVKRIMVRSNDLM